MGQRAGLTGDSRLRVTRLSDILSGGQNNEDPEWTARQRDRTHAHRMVRWRGPIHRDSHQKGAQAAKGSPPETEGVGLTRPFNNPPQPKEVAINEPSNTESYDDNTDTQDGADEGIDLDYIELGESGA